MRATWTIFAALLLAAAPGTAPAPARAAGSVCPAQAVDTLLTAPLTRTTVKVRSGGELVIVAIGSSSTAGYGATGPHNTYPARLAVELRERLPGVAVKVINKGVGQETTPDMVKRFERDVFVHKPDLVIWQLGTNAVLKDERLAGFAPPVLDGISRLKAAGADVILMNPQYAPKVIKDPDHIDMLNLLDSVGRQENVSVFGRFAIMRDWVQSGATDFDGILSPDGLHMNDASYRCVAQLLADAIAVSVAPAPELAKNPRR
jgi:lysophospholipase L1-like esterase